MPNAQVRGIYTTAITRLLLDHGYGISNPTVEVCRRFHIAESPGKADIIVRDREDRQGVNIAGQPEEIEAALRFFRAELSDCIVRFKPRKPLERAVNLATVELEFPWESKLKLDELRSAVTPTVRLHHYLKACGGELASAVDMAERLLASGRPSEEVEEKLSHLLLKTLPSEGSAVTVEHVKLDGRVILQRNAKLEHADGATGCLRWLRVFNASGSYDGLKARKESGDVAVAETRVGGWVVKTLYYSRLGAYKGQYNNINTPVELYPWGIRYVDLEIDVVADVEDGSYRIIDRKKLWEARESGVISAELLRKAEEVASRLLETKPEPEPYRINIQNGN